jgi:hydrogenase maturation protease
VIPNDGKVIGRSEEGGPAAPGGRPSLRSVTVLGIGNLIAGDDGFGIHALRELQRRLEPSAAAIEFVDGGVLGLELLTIVESSGRLIVLDTVDAALEPGALIELDADQIAAPRAGRVSVHQVAFNDLVALARLRGRLPDEFLLLGVQPSSTATSDHLTSHVLTALPAVVERALSVLRSWGALS